MVWVKVEQSVEEMVVELEAVLLLELLALVQV